jgi:phage N-6-adenine-methyltransferase
MSKKVTGKSVKKRPRGRPRLLKHCVQTNAECCHRSYLKRRRQKRVYWQHASDLWSTPQAEFDRLHAEFGFTLDACALPENAKCPVFYSPEQDGLAQDWRGVMWCNPPYSTVDQWIAKAYEASKAGATVVCVTYAKVDTRWWHTYIEPFAEYRFPKGRWKFGDGKNSAPFPGFHRI